jgi:F-type H+-transporting ATPase subunit b
MRLTPLTTVALVILPALLSMVDTAWAGDGFEFTRATYDLIMRWVNFTILVVLIVKYARRPVISFLKDKRTEVKQSIEQLKTEKRQAEAKIREIEIELEAGKERLSLIKDRIVADGQRRKEQLIEAATKQSAIMLTTAGHKIDAQIRERKQQLRSELVDMATDIAFKKLPERISNDDQERLLKNWIDAIQS